MGLRQRIEDLERRARAADDGPPIYEVVWAEVGETPEPGTLVLTWGDDKGEQGNGETKTETAG